MLELSSAEQVADLSGKVCTSRTIILRLTTEEELLGVHSKLVNMVEAYSLSVLSDPDCVILQALQPVGAFYAAVSLISLAQGLLLSYESIIRASLCAAIT